MKRTTAVERVEAVSKLDVVSGKALLDIYSYERHKVKFLEKVPDVFAEYILIKNKDSLLSSNQRKILSAYVAVMLKDRNYVKSLRSDINEKLEEDTNENDTQEVSEA